MPKKKEEKQVDWDSPAMNQPATYETRKTGTPAGSGVTGITQEQMNRTLINPSGLPQAAANDPKVLQAIALRKQIETDILVEEGIKRNILAEQIKKGTEERQQSEAIAAITPEQRAAAAQIGQPSQDLQGNGWGVGVSEQGVPTSESVKGKIGSERMQKATEGALKYGALGALGGSAVPGIGTAIGAATGAATGFVSGYLSTTAAIKEEIKQEKVNEWTDYSTSIQRIEGLISDANNKRANPSEIMEAYNHELALIDRTEKNLKALSEMDFAGNKKELIKVQSFNDSQRTRTNLALQQAILMPDPTKPYFIPDEFKATPTEEVLA